MRTTAEVLLCAAVGVTLVACALFVRLSFVAGHSMEPALVRGDLCVVLSGAEVRRGDIVLYRREGDRPVMHRVMAVEPCGDVRTKGDANKFEDAAVVEAREVSGRTVAVLPLGRAFRGWKRAVRGATLLTQSR